MTPSLLPDPWSCLLGEHDASSHWTSEDLKDAMALDLEDLLNTRQAIPEAALNNLPHARRSVLAYGMLDFSAMCMSSEADRDRLCASVAATISRYEPRLDDVRVRLSVEASSINRISFFINARLKGDGIGQSVCFDGMLEPSGQRCSIRRLPA